MTDIDKLTDILRKFADDKRRQGNELLSMKGGVFREKNYALGRLRQHEADEIVRYSIEIGEWYRPDQRIENRKAMLIERGKESYKELGGIANKHAKVVRGLIEIIEELT